VLSLIVWDSILSQIAKPGRYLNHEWHSVHKDWDKTILHTVVAYPDIYEVGMSCLAIHILYNLLNSDAETLCERVFLPADDMMDVLKNRSMKLTSLESRRALDEFDAIFFSIPYPLLYPNIVKMLELGGIPVWRADRHNEPLIIGGGIAVVNPLPIAPFFDLFLIGEAEPLIPRIIPLLKAWSKRELTRDELYKEAAQIEGVWVPAIGNKAKRVYAKEIPAAPKLIVPLVETTHDRLVIEVSRGCTRGCRFCQVGMVTRPYRERDITEIIKLIDVGLLETGYNEVSLLALSLSDYSGCEDLIKRVATKYPHIQLSLPSLRGDAITHEIAPYLTGGITIAPEAGTERLRKIINKQISEDDILRSVELATSYNITHVKLYFMIGLPGEEWQDIEAIVKLIRRIAAVAYPKQVKVSISPFVPQPFTPFQWKMFADRKELSNKARHIRAAFRGRRGVEVHYRNPDISYIETILGRGDEKVAPAIVEASKAGITTSEEGRFDFHTWEEAFTKIGVDPSHYTSELKVDELLPWEHYIDVGVKREFLIQESARTDETPDCRIQGCYGCGVCKGMSPIPIRLERLSRKGDIVYGRRPIKIATSSVVYTLRIRYGKEPELRWVGHLDTTRTMIRALLRAKLPVVFTKGYKPHPRVAFGPPLPFGMFSYTEYMDVVVSEPPADVVYLVNRKLPKGFKVFDVKVMPGTDHTSLFQLFNEVEYVVYGIKLEPTIIKQFMHTRGIWVNKRNKRLNLRASVKRMELKDGNLHIKMTMGRLNAFDVLAYLTGGKPEEMVIHPVERILRLP